MSEKNNVKNNYLMSEDTIVMLSNFGNFCRAHNLKIVFFPNGTYEIKMFKDLEEYEKENW